MAAKRKTKRTTTPREDLAQPTKWRLQHGGFSAPVREADPDTGTTVVHRRAVDTLGLMLAHGTITQAMYDAGCVFRTLFRRAALDSLTRSQLIRLPGGTADELSDRTVDARRKVAEALDVLGGHDSAAGSCAWYVLGLETSVREWAMRQGWGGRPVPPTQAQGMLVATLSVLAAHFGLILRSTAA
jgi:hypothetical protein